MELCRANTKNNPIVQEYILPDLSSNRRGHVRDPDDIVSEADQILVMNNERFAVPEVIFHPDDIGEFITRAFILPFPYVDPRSGSVWPCRNYCSINIPPT